MEFDEISRILDDFDDLGSCETPVGVMSDMCARVASASFLLTTRRDFDILRGNIIAVVSRNHHRGVREPCKVNATMIHQHTWYSRESVIFGNFPTSTANIENQPNKDVNNIASKAPKPLLTTKIKRAETGSTAGKIFWTSQTRLGALEDRKCC